MEGIHDLGGMQGFGPVEVEANEPVFHQAWEGRTFAIAGAVLTTGMNTPMFRHAIERMEPGHYLTSGYYDHWLTAVATLLVEDGLLSREELEGRAGSFPLSQPATVTRDDVGTPAPAPQPRFAVGDVVRVREARFGGHTRCPGYVFGRRGTIAAIEAPAPIPELEAHRREKLDETIYSVRFESSELWGEVADANSAVHVDLYEHYLEPVGAEST